MCLYGIGVKSTKETYGSFFLRVFHGRSVPDLLDKDAAETFTITILSSQHHVINSSNHNNEKYSSHNQLQNDAGGLWETMDVSGLAFASCVIRM